MKKYSYETIDELVQPVMEMMREEFPNDCVLVIDAKSAQLEYRHGCMTFLNRPLFAAGSKSSEEAARKYIERIADIVKNSGGASCPPCERE